jgi:hypothetical protein
MLTLLAAHVHHHAHHGIPGIVGTLLYIIAVIATIIAAIGLLLSLFNSTARFPINWVYAAVVAVIAWVLVVVLF